MPLTNAERQARFRLKQASRYVTRAEGLPHKTQQQLGRLALHLRMSPVETIAEALARLEHELTRAMSAQERQTYTGKGEPLRNEPLIVPVAPKEARHAREQLRQKALMRRHRGP